MTVLHGEYLSVYRHPFICSGKNDIFEDIHTNNYLCFNLDIKYWISQVNVEMYEYDVYEWPSMPKESQ